MSKPIIVLETSGKNEDVDRAKIRLFDSESKARDFCIPYSKDQGKKHWTYREIIEEGEEIELCWPALK